MCTFVKILCFKKMRIHQEGVASILLVFSVLAVVIVAVFYFSKSFYPTVITALASGLLWLVVVYFFRVPHRNLAMGEQVIVSPANGKVVEIKEVVENEFLKEPCIQVAIFMSPLNVHLNKYPISGEIIYSKYHPGKYLVAWAPKSSEVNERHSVVIRHKDGSRILVKQIAGFLARRIVNYAKVGSVVNQNEEIGFIKFGSRVDIFIPLKSKIQVSIGQSTIEGVTQIAEL